MKTSKLNLRIKKCICTNSYTLIKKERKPCKTVMHWCEIKSLNCDKVIQNKTYKLFYIEISTLWNNVKSVKKWYAPVMAICGCKENINA